MLTFCAGGLTAQAEGLRGSAVLPGDGPGGQVPAADLEDALFDTGIPPARGVDDRLGQERRGAGPVIWH